MRTLYYGLTGKLRKQLVDALAQILAMDSEYLGPPNYAYQVGDYIVNRDGNIEMPDDTEQSNIDFIIDELRKEHFVTQGDENDGESENNSSPTSDKSLGDEENSGDSESAEELSDSVDNNEELDAELNDQVEETTAPATDDLEDNTDIEVEQPTSELVKEPNDATVSEDNKITISIPRDGIDPDCLKRIQAIIASKAPVLKVALEADDLSIISTDNELRFPWFTDHGIEGEAQAYADLIAAIVARAKKLTRVTASKCARDNDKFVMRLFLVALEMKGDRYKDTRRILMRNLKGDGGWRTQEAKDRHDAKVGKVEKTIDVSVVQIIEGGEENEQLSE